MKREVVGLCAALCVANAIAAWRYVSADDSENKYDGVAYITDDTWAIKVAEWKESATTFKTVTGSKGYLAGEGVMDLTDVEEDLGRTWTFEGGYQYGSFFNFKTLTEVVLPKSCTSICASMFYGCSELTKVTVPSGYLLSIGNYAFCGCSKLQTSVPESAFSGRCASYGETCFMNCTSLKIPFRWTLDGNLSCKWRAFHTTKIPEFDLSGVKGASINLTGYANTATNLVWGPNSRTFVASEFGLTDVFFTGILPPDTTYTPAQNRTVRFFCDPLMDASWKNDTVMGVALSRPAEEDFAAYAEKFGVTAEEAARSVLGWYSTGSGHRLWLVTWKSPFNVGVLPLVAAPMRAETGSVECVPEKPEGYEEGERVTVTAHPAPGYAFSCWCGQIPDGIDIRSPSVTFRVEASYELTAVMTNCLGWTHRAATDDEPELVTDGNWAFKVSAWNSKTFKTEQGSKGYLSGAGVLDLTNVEEDLGRTWTFDGGYQIGQFSNIKTLTEIVLPKSCTSICDGMFYGCSALTKVTVPSGYLLSIKRTAFGGCSKLQTSVPESAFSGRCAYYGENCFGECPSLKIPFRWTLDGNLSCDYRAFQGTKIPEFDLSGVKGESISLTGVNNAATNLVWGPNARTFVASEFGLTNVFFTGILPLETTYKPVEKRTVRFFCDPLMDASWENDTVMGVELTRPEEADFAAYAEKFGVTAEEAARSVLGWYSTGSGHRLWLVTWKSPFRRKGLTITIR